METKEFRQKYQAEIKKIDTRCEELEQENVVDLQKIEDKQKEYTEAVGNFEEEKADKLHDEIFDIKKAVANRNAKLSILRSKDPEKNGAVKKAANDLFNSLVEEKKGLKDKAMELAKEAFKAKQAYLEAVSAIVPLNQAYSTNRAGINSVIKSVDPELVKGEGFHPKLGDARSTDLCNIYDFKVDTHEFIDYHNAKGNEKNE